MATANLQETLLSYTLRRNQLNLMITEYQSQKTLATYSQADAQSLHSAHKREIRDFYKALWNEDPSLQAQYRDYTEIPDFDDEIDKITAQLQDELDELTAWETSLDAQITTASAELEEVNAYMESIQSMLTSNIQDDYNFGLGQ